jgi:hypothetical protein
MPEYRTFTRRLGYVPMEILREEPKSERWNMRKPCSCGRRTSITGTRVSIRLMQAIEGSAYHYAVLDGTTAYLTDGATTTVPCSGPCDKTVRLHKVTGKVRPEIKCSAICTGARGFDCSCSCGGHNHGSTA